MDLMFLRRSILFGKRDEEMGNIKAIISHGTEWIDTGYLPNSNQIFLIDYSIESYYQYRHIIGASCDSNHRLLVQEISETTMACATFVNGNGYSLPMTTYGLNVRTLGLIAGGFSSYDGTDVEPLTATKPLLLFGGYYHHSMETRHSACRFYGLKIVDAMTLKPVRNYVPWLDDDDVPCVKELMTNTLYYNSGSGTLGYIDLNDTIHD